VQNQELHGLLLLEKCYQGDQIKEDEIGWTCSKYERRKLHRKFLELKREGNKTLGRPRCRWEDNIKIGVKEIG
jgi:hypothetical protein